MSLKAQDNSKIDVVYTYVDGNDPEFISKLNQYKRSNSEGNSSSNNTKLRYESVDEILYSLRSLFKFAPFINQVFIITYNQKPAYESIILEHFPERIDSVKIVDHKDLFGEYPEIYPSFNSTSIETFLWRIPELSENFVYFNDDTLLMNPVRPEDWFKNSIPINLGKWKLGKLWKFRKFQNRLDRGLSIRLNFTYRQYRGARLQGFKYLYPYYYHTPKPFSKSTLQKAFEMNKEVILKNAAHRFRVADSFDIISYFMASQLKFLKPVSSIKKEIYINFANQNEKYISQKINALKNRGSKQYLCLQSLSNANTEIQEEVISILEQILTKE